MLFSNRKGTTPKSLASKDVLRWSIFAIGSPLNANFTDLRFEVGEISDVTLEGVDVLVALHACDTATDDAIYRGIAAKAQLIFLAPCCHKELRPQLTPPR